MIYFDSDEKSKISKDEFKRIFGKDYDEFDEDIEFDAAFCVMDPFLWEIKFVNWPIIAGSEAEMQESYDISEQEI
ncbi:hypothetical protein MYO4S_00261 [Serratia phage 4S]|nr:hypothetical protein MYO4S_00261 [Serratia phage 4S]